MSKLPKVGVFFGKMTPCHLGHINAIIEASTQVEKLYVVVSENRNTTIRLSEEAGVAPMWGQLRVQWLSQSFQDVEHIKVTMIDETNIPTYPNGWAQWSDLIASAVGEHIDMFFCGEPEYVDQLKTYFRNCEVSLFDSGRTEVNISATKVRQNPYENWQYLVPAARPHFAKKVLVAGTASCGKTSLVKMLAKTYNTSWSEEVGRYYAQKYLGGSEEFFVSEDFRRIAHLQYEQDYQALRTANKIAFFDTDAVVTQYYSEMYLGEKNAHVASYIDPSRYDVVLFLMPSVKFVDDGQRIHETEDERKRNADKLLAMYEEAGFGDKIIIIEDDNYLGRLHKAKDAVQELIAPKNENNYIYVDKINATAITAKK